jgi:hypothetical protein
MQPRAVPAVQVVAVPARIPVQVASQGRGQGGSRPVPDPESDPVVPVRVQDAELVGADPTMNKHLHLMWLHGPTKKVFFHRTEYMILRPEHLVIRERCALEFVLAHRFPHLFPRAMRPVIEGARVVLQPPAAGAMGSVVGMDVDGKSDAEQLALKNLRKALYTKQVRTGSDRLGVQLHDKFVRFDDVWAPVGENSVWTRAHRLVRLLFQGDMHGVWLHQLARETNPAERNDLQSRLKDVQYRGSWLHAYVSLDAHELTLSQYMGLLHLILDMERAGVAHLDLHTGNVLYADTRSEAEAEADEDAKTAEDRDKDAEVPKLIDLLTSGCWNVNVADQKDAKKDEKKDEKKNEKTANAMPSGWKMPRTGYGAWAFGASEALEQKADANRRMFVVTPFDQDVVGLGRKLLDTMLSTDCPLLQMSTRAQILYNLLRYRTCVRFTSKEADALEKTLPGQAKNTLAAWRDESGRLVLPFLPDGKDWISDNDVATWRAELDALLRNETDKHKCNKSGARTDWKDVKDKDAAFLEAYDANLAKVLTSLLQDAESGVGAAGADTTPSSVLAEAYDMHLKQWGIRPVPALLPAFALLSSREQAVAAVREDSVPCRLARNERFMRMVEKNLSDGKAKPAARDAWQAVAGLPALWGAVNKMCAERFEPWKKPAPFELKEAEKKHYLSVVRRMINEADDRQVGLCLLPPKPNDKDPQTYKVAPFLRTESGHEWVSLDEWLQTTAYRPSTPVLLEIDERPDVSIQQNRDMMSRETFVQKIERKRDSKRALPPLEITPDLARWFAVASRKEKTQFDEKTYGIASFCKSFLSDYLKAARRPDLRVWLPKPVNAHANYVQSMWSVYSDMRTPTGSLTFVFEPVQNGWAVGYRYENTAPTSDYVAYTTVRRSGTGNPFAGLQPNLEQRTRAWIYWREESEVSETLDGRQNELRSKGPWDETRAHFPLPHQWAVPGVLSIERNVTVNIAYREQGVPKFLKRLVRARAHVEVVAPERMSGPR